MSIIRPVTTTIIDFFDLERITNSAAHTKAALEKLDRELQFYRPKAGRTITDLSSGQAGYLPTPKPKDPSSKAAIWHIKDQLERLAAQFAKEAKGFEKSCEAQILPVFELIQQMNADCDRYSR